MMTSEFSSAVKMSLLNSRSLYPALPSIPSWMSKRHIKHNQYPNLDPNRPAPHSVTHVYKDRLHVFNCLVPGVELGNRNPCSLHPSKNASHLTTSLPMHYSYSTRQRHLSTENPENSFQMVSQIILLQWISHHSQGENQNPHRALLCLFSNSGLLGILSLRLTLIRPH